MPNPRESRLLSDYKKVKKLAAESGGSLTLVSAAGSPPLSYVIEYHCPGLVKEAGKVNLSHRHQVLIQLGANYPFEKPTARMLTPIFNPHVFTSNAICLGGVWSPVETLASLILRIGALLQLDPRVLDFRSPANFEANLWVQNNRHRLPLGNVTFVTPEPDRGRLAWE
jgi:ubiquitin-protein ligase